MACVLDDFSVGIGNPGRRFGRFATAAALQVASVIHRDQRRSQSVDHRNECGKLLLARKGRRSVVRVGIRDRAGGPVIQSVDAAVSRKAEVGDSGITEQFYSCRIERLKVPTIGGYAQRGGVEHRF